MNKRAVGTRYEEVAANYLTNLGYEIVEMNFRCPLGEIDIVAKDNKTITFVEVKYRKNLLAGDPFEAINAKKQNTIRKVASWYMSKNPYMDVPVRFDVVGILGDEVRLIKGAF